MSELTAKEKRAIAALKRVAAQWPASLWLFSASGTLSVMQKNEHGERARDPNGGMDQAFLVDTVAIENDGGDW